MRVKFVFFLFSVILLLFPTSSAAQKTVNTTFSILRFNDDNQYNLTILGRASIHGGALQITEDSLNSFVNVPNLSGRVMFPDQFKLYERSNYNSSTSFLASFSTSFLVNIYRLNSSSPGEGLTFVIAPNLDIPDNSYGPWLGLTNSSTDGNKTNQFIAVELDTVKQSFDPDDNHVGLDVNGVVSNVTYSDKNIQLAPVTPINYTIWIDYNGNLKVMNIYIEKQGKPKPANPVINKDINIAEILNPLSYFGFSASTGNTSQLNCVLQWNFTINSLAIDDSALDDKDSPKIILILSILLPLLVLTIALFSGAIWYWKKKKSEDPRLLNTLRSLPGAPRNFPFKELRNATNNFDEKLKLGQGGFGMVYKGFLQKEKTEIAVKKFSRESVKRRDDFLAELTIIHRLHHKNLVRLLGWCHENGVLLLVYRYMPNGSLDQHLYGETKPPLSWEKRYNIIKGLASAIYYLHNDYEQRVLHRDLKASNVMLDSDYNARLGDFGLARVLDDEEDSYAVSAGVPGTIGYIAPECFHTGKASSESDIYGFGAVILETVCGQRPLIESGTLVDHVWGLYREGCIEQAVDPKLKTDFDVEDARSLLLLGLACSHPLPSNRPKSYEINQILLKAAPPPVVPHFRPSFVWPLPTEMFSFHETTDTSVMSSLQSDSTILSLENPQVKINISE